MRVWLVLVALLPLLMTAPRASAQNCFDVWSDDCALVNTVTWGRVLADALPAFTGLPIGFVPPAGAGAVIVPDDDMTQGCSVTPSTGRGSGINLRAAPSLDSSIVGDIPLGFFRQVSAISDNWYETVTRDGRLAYVSAELSTLVGACGDVPRFVVTP